MQLTKQPEKPLAFFTIAFENMLSSYPGLEIGVEIVDGSEDLLDLFFKNFPKRILEGNVVILNPSLPSCGEETSSKEQED